MKQLTKFVAATALACAASAAFAQAFPNKPIRVLLTFSSGGQADLLARMAADRMSAALGQPFVVEAKPGAGGNLAMEAVAKAPADGYTLVFGTPAVAINGSLFKKLSYDPVKDLAPISLMAWGPYAVYASATLPVNNIAEFIAYAKARPGQINYASVGIGSGTHLAAVLFASAAGLQMTHVPYKGIQQAAPDLVSGQVHLTFNAIGPLAGFLQTGKIKLLANSGPRRLRAFPDVPTIAESVPGFDAGGWYGYFGTAGMPRDVLQRLNTELVAVVKHPEIVDRIEKMALFATPQTLDEAAKFVAEEAEKWSRAVKVSGATAE